MSMNSPIRRLEDSLPIQLLATHDLVMNSFRPTLKKHNLTDQKWRILRFIAQNEMPEFHAVAKACLLKRASLSRTLVSLENSGWVKRGTNGKDKRQVYLQLSKEGQTFHDQVALDFSAVFDALKRQMGEEATKLLAALKETQRMLGSE